MRLTLLLLALGLSAGAHAEDAYLQVEGSSEAIGSGALLQAVGIKVNGDALQVILPKNCKLPCVRSQTFSAITSDQPRIGFHLFRGDSPSVKNAHDLGIVHVSGYSATRDGKPSVVIKFVADSSGISLSAKDVTLDHVAP